MAVRKERLKTWTEAESRKLEGAGVVIPARKLVVSRGKDRHIPQKTVSLLAAISAHRVALRPLRADAEADARACGFPAGPAALYVADRLRGFPLVPEMVPGAGISAQETEAQADAVNLGVPAMHRRANPGGRRRRAQAIARAEAAVALQPADRAPLSRRQYRRMRQVSWAATSIIAAQAAGATMGGIAAAGFAAVDEMARVADADLPMTVGPRRGVGG
jgi:hypothetical protein